MADAKLLKKTILMIGYGVAGTKACAALAKTDKVCFVFDFFPV